jgi:hypothetical protein
MSTCVPLGVRREAGDETPQGTCLARESVLGLLDHEHSIVGITAKGL